MPLPQPSKSSAAVPFIKLKEGQNRLRIVSGPVERYSHFLSSEKRSVQCTERPDCQYCAEGIRVNHDYFLLAISRNEQLENKTSDGQVGEPTAKLVRFAPSLYADYFNLSQNPDWEFDEVPDYDIVITRTGTGLDTRYSITPGTKKELSETDKKVVTNSKTAEEWVNEALGGQMIPKKESASKEIDIEDIPF